jgi:hypothetical protein
MCNICEYVQRVVNSKKVRKTVKKVMAVSGNHIQFELAYNSVKIWLLTEDKEPLMYLGLTLEELTPKSVKENIIALAVGYYEAVEERDQQMKRANKYPMLNIHGDLISDYRAMQNTLDHAKGAAKEHGTEEEQELLRKLTLTLRNAKVMINQLEERTILQEVESFPKDDLIDRVVRGLKFIFKIK